MMNRFRQIANEICEILKDEFPDMVWLNAVSGPAYPKELTGYICCDSITYELFSKEKRQASAVFTIEIISPNPKGKETDAQYIEDLAMEVDEVLRENETIDGWAESSNVDKILFATPAGMTNIGLAIFQFTVTYTE